MDGFNEQVVKRATKAKNIVIKILSVVILLFIPVLFTFLAFTITTYMFYVGLFLFIGEFIWYGTFFPARGWNLSIRLRAMNLKFQR